MPTSAAPNNNAIPAKARITTRSTKRAKPTGPRGVIQMRVVWCWPADAQIRDPRCQSAPGGMISGSMEGGLAPGMSCWCITRSLDELTNVMWDGEIGPAMRWTRRGFERNDLAIYVYLDAGTDIHFPAHMG